MFGATCQVESYGVAIVAVFDSSLLTTTTFTLNAAHNYNFTAYLLFGTSPIYHLALGSVLNYVSHSHQNICFRGTFSTHSPQFKWMPTTLIQCSFCCLFILASYLLGTGPELTQNLRATP
jgi:hypothetical protein